MMPPHPSLAAYYADPSAKPAFVNQLFDAGAPFYDGAVQWGFLHSGASYRRRALQQHGLRRPHHLLDVACGTGLVAVEAARLLGTADHITCLDPSSGMLAIARTKLRAHFVQGRAEAIPLPDDSFDFLTLGYALRHVTDLETTFREFHRVLKPGGKLLILEVTKPTGPIPEFLFRLYFGRVYPFLTRLFTRSAAARTMMSYFWATMDAGVRPATVLAGLRAAGLIHVERKSVLGLFSEYTAGKPHPGAPFHARDCLQRLPANAAAPDTAPLPSPQPLPARPHCHG